MSLFTALSRPTLYQEPQTWLDASYTCKQDGGTLMTDDVLTRYVNSGLLTALRSNGVGTAWYGKFVPPSNTYEGK